MLVTSTPGSAEEIVRLLTEELADGMKTPPVVDNHIHTEKNRLKRRAHAPRLPMEKKDDLVTTPFSNFEGKIPNSNGESPEPCRRPLRRYHARSYRRWPLLHRLYWYQQKHRYHLEKIRSTAKWAIIQNESSSPGTSSAPDHLQSTSAHIVENQIGRLLNNL